MGSSLVQISIIHFFLDMDLEPNAHISSKNYNFDEFPPFDPVTTDVSDSLSGRRSDGKNVENNYWKSAPDFFSVALKIPPPPTQSLRFLPEYQSLSSVVKNHDVSDLLKITKSPHQISRSEEKQPHR